MSIRFLQRNLVARHNQLLRVKSNGQPLERSQVPHEPCAPFASRFPYRGSPLKPSFQLLQCRCASGRSPPQQSEQVEFASLPTLALSPLAATLINLFAKVL